MVNLILCLPSGLFTAGCGNADGTVADVAGLFEREAGLTGTLVLLLVDCAFLFGLWYLRVRKDMVGSCDFGVLEEAAIVYGRLDGQIVGGLHLANIGRSCALATMSFTVSLLHAPHVQASRSGLYPVALIR